MHPDQLISELAAKLQLPELAFNDEHVCRLVMDDHYIVDLEWVESRQALHVYSVIHPRASELQHRFAELLAANLFGRATCDAVLALDIERDEVVLNRRFELERLDMDGFMHQLDLFSDAVSHWTERLQQQHQPADDPQKHSSTDHSASGFIRV